MSKARFNWRIFGVLSGAHFINDMYANFLPQLLPFLLSSRGFSLTQGANMVALFTISASFLQPFFGYLVDMKGQRWLVSVGTLWMALLLGLSGLIPSYPLLLLVITLAGLGTAAFHPQASAMIGHIGGSRKGLILASFIALGNLGLAVSPLIYLPMFSHFGIRTTWVVIFPGVLTTLLLYFLAPSQEAQKENEPGLGQVFAALGRASGELGKLMLVVAIRSLVHTGLMILLPLYFLARNYSPAVTGSLVFATLAIGAVGGVIGGYISDRFGRKPLIVGSLGLASVVFYGFLNTSGAISFVLLGLGGMCLLSSFSVTVAAAQDVIPENKAMASGLSLGFAIGMGGLAVSPLGRYADLHGVEAAVHLVFVLPVFAALIALFLKGDERAAGKVES